jgi:putative phage-type endonuclease
MQQQTPEWIEMRKGKIGSSDAPVIMGVSPWTTPYQKWEEKLGLTAKQKQTIYMERGIELEEQARQVFEKETGLIMSPQVIQHPTIDYMIASLDGIDVSQKNIVEIKCPGFKDHESALDGHVPDKYYPQLQHQMTVCGLDKAYYFSYDGQSGKILEVYRNADYEDLMLLKEAEFWNYMQNFIPPPLTDRDYVEKNDEFWESISKEWIKCHRELQTMKIKEEELRKRLIFMCGKSNAKGGGVKLSKVVRKGPIDYESIPELIGVDLEKHRKEKVESFRLTECN